MTRREDVFSQGFSGQQYQKFNGAFCFLLIDLDSCLLARGKRGFALRTFLEDEMSGVQDARSDP